LGFDLNLIFQKLLEAMPILSLVLGVYLRRAHLAEKKLEERNKKTDERLFGIESSVKLVHEDLVNIKLTLASADVDNLREDVQKLKEARVRLETRLDNSRRNS
jgi:hypothetical protein